MTVIHICWRSAPCADRTEWRWWTLMHINFLRLCTPFFFSCWYVCCCRVCSMDMYGCVSPDDLGRGADDGEMEFSERKAVDSDAGNGQVRRSGSGRHWQHKINIFWEVSRASLSGMEWDAVSASWEFFLRCFYGNAWTGMGSQSSFLVFCITKCGFEWQALV